MAASIPGRAAAAGLVQFNLVQLRDFTHDRHQTVDDYAYGGGAGMVLKPEPFFEAVESLGPVETVVLLSARGRRFGHDDAVRFSLGTAAHAALRALQGRGPAGGRGAGHRGAVGRRLRALGRRAGGALRAGRRGAAPPGRPGRPRVGQLGLALRRTPEPAELYPAAGVPRAWRCPRCCSRAITPGSRRGGRRRRSGSTRERRPDVLASRDDRTGQAE